MSSQRMHRVKNLGSGDLLLGHELNKAEGILNELEIKVILTINDAIELRQCKLLLEGEAKLKSWTDERFDELKSVSAKANSIAMREIRQRIKVEGIILVFNEVEKHYRDAFWELFAASSSEELVNPNDIDILLGQNEHQLRALLKHRKLVRMFSDILRNKMLLSPMRSIKIVMDALVVSHITPIELHLPASLTEEDVAGMMNTFISQEELHFNYLDLIANWPSSVKYRIPPETKLAARRKSEQEKNRVFEESGSYEYGTIVEFSKEQEVCVRVSFEGSYIRYSYGVEWIAQHRDFATLLNNFIHVFQFVDRYSNLVMPAHKNDARPLTSLFETRANKDYETGVGFSLTDARVRGIIRLYREVLISLDIKLEDVITWFFNDYIKDEFCVAGFYVNMPSEGTTYLEKCKALCSEIERMLKAYTLYVEKGEVDPELLGYLDPFSGFTRVPSLLKQKYARGASKSLEQVSFALFSDQSSLFYTEKNEEEFSCLFELLCQKSMELADFSNYQQSGIQWLLDYGVLTKDDKTQRVKPTARAAALRVLWNDGVVACHHLVGADLEVIDELTSAGDLEYYSALFSDDEAKYMSFSFDNKEFSNARAVRNKYSHGGVDGRSPNNKEHQSSYEVLLLLIVSIILKINDELCTCQNKADIIEFVEWPFQEFLRETPQSC